MEKLILKCGRFIPPTSGDTESRVKLIETYLSGLTQELEYLLGEMDRVLEALESAYAERDSLTVVALPGSAEEGSV